LDDGPVPDDVLDAAELRERVLGPDRLWSALDVVAETGSTNADLLAAARAGAAEGAVLVAEHQTVGRGRQGRTWTARPGAALTFSVLLRPVTVPAAARGWLPLLAGVAVVRALHALTDAEVALKWPNDVLGAPAPSTAPATSNTSATSTTLTPPAPEAPAAPGPLDGFGKLAGILAEQAGDAIVIGIGLNVGGAADDLPPVAPGALPPVSLALLGDRSVRRGELLAALLDELEGWYRAWTRPGADPAELAGEYRRWCATIGQEVRVQLPGGAELAGRATGIDDVGRLVVAGPDGPVAVSAGDVVHVR
jgi:BirA family biotin operon repressor/biotin-[acetyl-CoA-carboxylase] ligase